MFFIMLFGGAIIASYGVRTLHRRYRNYDIEDPEPAAAEPAAAEPAAAEPAAAEPSLKSLVVKEAQAEEKLNLLYDLITCVFCLAPNPSHTVMRNFCRNCSLEFGKVACVRCYLRIRSFEKCQLCALPNCLVPYDQLMAYVGPLAYRLRQIDAKPCGNAPKGCKVRLYNDEMLEHVPMCKFALECPVCGNSCEADLNEHLRTSCKKLKCPAPKCLVLGSLHISRCPLVRFLLTQLQEVPKPTLIEDEITRLRQDYSFVFFKSDGNAVAAISCIPLPPFNPPQHGIRAESIAESSDEDYD